MKTIEEKAKAYDKAFKEASVAHKDEDRHLKATLERIFPELAESEDEDEKIRKRLITDFGTIGKKKWGGLEVKDILAWLERQGEQIDTANKEYWRGYREGKKLILDKYAEVKKQSEQKFEMKTAEESLGVDSGTYNKIVDECIFGEQKPEENNGNIGRISPNSEWSEEDVFRTETLISVIKSGGSIRPELRNEFVNWLKSLRPQNHWKPSELQLGCLSDAIEYYNSLGYPASKLKELLDDLKKLKEGKV